MSEFVACSAADGCKVAIGVDGVRVFLLVSLYGQSWP